MAIVNDKFSSQFGFESPSFTVDTAGKIIAPTIDVETILLGGAPFVQYVPPADDGGDDSGTQVSNTFTSLRVTGTFKTVYLGNTGLSVVDGRVALNSSASGAPGTIDNVDIGYNSPGQIKAYGIDMTTAPDSTASNINADGASINGDVKVANNLLMQTDPTIGTHATHKKYVDKTAVAFAVAFGV